MTDAVYLFGTLSTWRRHAPAAGGPQRDAGGWADTDAALRALEGTAR